jgi:3-oxoacyl-[acyl-carrier protein] reductase
MVSSDTTALVVSGTANSGRAVARKVADAGGTVGFTYNSAESEAEALLDELGDGHEMWQCDVGDADETAAVVDEAFETLGHVDAIVFTVGVISRATVGELDPETWGNHLDANVTGAYNLIHAAAPELEAQGDGAIVALSASPGVLRSDQLAAYDASKRGLEALVEETARDLGPHGVRANVVAPGFIRDADALSEEQRADLLEQVPYKRITTPEDVADACLYLCSDDAAVVTGAVLPVDSGLAL